MFNYTKKHRILSQIATKTCQSMKKLNNNEVEKNKDKRGGE